MSTLNRTDFEGKYNNGTSGLYRTSQSRGIGSDDIRTQITDLKDSFLNNSDQIKNSPTAAQQLSTDYNVPSLYSCGSFRLSGVMNSAAILSANSSPITLIPAPGSGLVVLPIQYFFKLDYNSVAYATNTTFRIYLNGNDMSGSISTLLTATADTWRFDLPSEFTTTTSPENAALVFQVDSGNPTSGNSTIDWTVIYRIVPTLPEA